MSATIKAKGEIRVAVDGERVVLNVFGTYASLSVRQVDGLILTLEEALDEALEQS